MLVRGMSWSAAVSGFPVIGIILRGPAGGLPVWSGQCSSRRGDDHGDGCGSGLRAAGDGERARRCWRSSARGWTGSGACHRCRCGAIPSSRRRSWPGSAGRGRSRELDAGQGNRVHGGLDAGPQHSSAKAMVTALRSLLRFLHVTGRAPGPLVGAVPAVANWRGLGPAPQVVRRAGRGPDSDGCDTRHRGRRA